MLPLPLPIVRGAVGVVLLVVGMPFIAGLSAPAPQASQPKAAQPPSASGEGGPRWVFLRKWAEDFSKPKEPKTVTTGQNVQSEGLAIGPITDGSFSYRWTYNYSAPFRKITDMIGTRYQGGTVRQVCARTHSWSVPPPELLPGRKLDLQVAISTAGSEYSVEPKEADTGFYKSRAFDTGETRGLVQLAEGREAAPGVNPPSQQTLAQAVATPARTPQPLAFDVPAGTTLFRRLRFSFSVYHPNTDARYTQFFEYSWQEKPVEKRWCDEAEWHYTPGQMAGIYSGTVPSLYYDRRALVEMILAAAQRWEREGGQLTATRLAIEAPWLAHTFINSHEPTGKEERLTELVVQEHAKTGKPLDPGQMFYLALKACNGDVRNALVALHSRLHRQRPESANINKQFIQQYLAPIRNPEGYSGEALMTQKEQGVEKKVSARQVMGDDQQGVWYHMFGTAAIQFVDQEGLTNYEVAFNKIRAKAEEKVADMLRTADDIKKWKPREGALGTRLSNYAIALEDAVRISNGRLPDPDKQCINYAGIAIAVALRNYLKLPLPVLVEGVRMDSDIPRYEQKLDYTVLVKSPVSLRITGVNGEEFFFDQAAKRFGGNTSGVLLDPFQEEDGTWGLLATPLFPVKEVEATGAREGEATVAVFRYGDRQTTAQTVPVRPGTRVPVPLKPGDTIRGPTLNLPTPSSGHLLEGVPPGGAFRLALTVRYSRPGAVLDTVGINAAPVGSFGLLITPAGKAQLRVYDPQRQSPSRDANGWHVAETRRTLPPEEEHSLEVQWGGGQIILRAGGEEAILALPTLPSRDPVYVGDFPGDDRWGPSYNIHPAMVGTVRVDELRPLQDPSGGSEALILDRAGVLSDKERADLAQAVGRIRANHGLEVALVFAGRASEEEVRTLAEETRRDLIRAGKLPQRSGVFVLFSADGKRRLWWNRDPGVETLVTGERVGEAWRSVPEGTSIGGAALHLLERLPSRG